MTATSPSSSQRAAERQQFLQQLASLGSGAAVAASDVKAPSSVFSLPPAPSTTRPPFPQPGFQALRPRAKQGGKQTENQRLLRGGQGAGSGSDDVDEEGDEDGDEDSDEGGDEEGGSKALVFSRHYKRGGRADDEQPECAGIRRALDGKEKRRGERSGGSCSSSGKMRDIGHESRRKHGHERDGKSESKAGKRDKSKGSKSKSPWAAAGEPISCALQID